MRNLATIFHGFLLFSTLTFKKLHEKRILFLRKLKSVKSIYLFLDNSLTQFPKEVYYFKFVLLFFHSTISSFMLRQAFSIHIYKNRKVPGVNYLSFFAQTILILNCLHPSLLFLTNVNRSLFCSSLTIFSC